MCHTNFSSWNLRRSQATQTDDPNMAIVDLEAEEDSPEPEHIVFPALSRLLSLAPEGGHACSLCDMWFPDRQACI